MAMFHTSQCQDGSKVLKFSINNQFDKHVKTYDCERNLPSMILIGNQNCLLVKFVQIPIIFLALRLGKLLVE